jgi:hypothetical protein
MTDLQNIDFENIPSDCKDVKDSPRIGRTNTFLRFKKRN